MTEREEIQYLLEKIEEYHRTVPLKEQWARLVALGIINEKGEVLMTRAEREAAGDPRPSLEERYKNHDGYVAAVKAAAMKTVAAGFLLQSDADKLVAEAAASNVLNALSSSR